MHIDATLNSIGDTHSFVHSIQYAPEECITCMGFIMKTWKNQELAS